MSITCNKCNHSNRDTARYCKHCGDEIMNTNNVSQQFDLDELVGLSELKKVIDEKITVANRMQQKGIQIDKATFHTILVGRTGTAKSKIADILAKIYFKNGIISKPDVQTVHAVDFDSFEKDLASNLNAAKGGIVFFDEVNKLVPADFIPGQTTKVDKLFAGMEKMEGDPIIFLASMPVGFKDYIKKNPEVTNKYFKLLFELSDLNENEMFEIAVKQFHKKNFSLSLEAESKLKKVFRFIVRNKDDSFGNGHKVSEVVDRICECHFMNPLFSNYPQIIQEDDIRGETFEEKTTQDILDELNKFIGMDDIKVYIRDMIKLIEVSKKDAEKTGKKYLFGEHLIFTGNPGTGKTTLARKLGELFYSIGLLSRGQVVEVDRSILVGQYVGETAKLVQKKCDEAMGGILFIDEAYTLKQDDRDNFGQEAIDTLLKRMEDDRGKMMVIAAGYKKEMQNFINSNPGLKSRFKEENIFDLKDYLPEELLCIFKGFVKEDNFQLSQDAERKLSKHIITIHEKRDKNFGNGREVRNLYDKCKKFRAVRLSNLENHDLIITEEDIPVYEDESKSISTEEALTKLNELIGLHSVKEEINKLIDYIDIEKERAKSGGEKYALNIHFIFKGNPGTGKTTVARILADIFKTLGLLTKGHLVETKRQHLVGEYVGQTALKTDKVIESAMGGVLFIDEAYTLSSGGSNDYGQESINTLLTKMEDERGKFIVIAAGYSNDMERFLKSNEGLTSRFTKHILFEDYTPGELTSIFTSMVKKKGMILEDNLHEHILDVFTDIYNHRDKNFANGRTVRNVFETVLENQATRIAYNKKSGIDIDPILNIITKEDFN